MVDGGWEPNQFAYMTKPFSPLQMNSSNRRYCSLTIHHPRDKEKRGRKYCRPNNYNPPLRHSD